MNSKLLEHIKASVDASVDAKREFYRTHAEAMVNVASLLAKTVENGGKILIFGNGGSAADAQHMAAEMVGKMLVQRKKPLAAVALTTDTSCLTAIGNDYGYEQVFELQVRALGKPGDVAFAISTSGNSKNVLRAVDAAREMGLKIVTMTGGSGGKLKEKAHYSLNVERGVNSTLAQETHITIVHLLVDLMDRFLLPASYVERTT